MVMEKGKIKERKRSEKRKIIRVDSSMWVHLEVGESILSSNLCAQFCFSSLAGSSLMDHNSHTFGMMENFRILISVLSVFCSIFCTLPGSTFYLHIHIKE